ncbi:MAG: ATP-binding protein [Planctomycetota bacterium]|nr:ATP-binding protein [Planctomycetota bacterium]
MGPRFRDRVRQAAQLGLAALALLLGGCGADLDDARQRAHERLERAAQVVGADLAGRIAACEAALADVGEFLEKAGDEPEARFEFLEALRARHELTGLLWRGVEEEAVWAGRVVEPRDLPAPRPWHRSFRTGRVQVHEGPFLRALVVGPVPVGGGEAVATYVLDEEVPDAAMPRAFRERWLMPLDVEQVRLLHPEAQPEDECADDCRRLVPVRASGGMHVLTADVRVHDLEVLRERVQADRGAVGGIFLLVLLALATYALSRFAIARLAHPTARWLSAGVIVLLVRGALRWLDLPIRFVALREAFSPSEFAVETWLGWLASAGDFALTAIVYMLVVICLTYAFQHLRIPTSLTGRIGTLLAALVTCSVAAGMWLKVVDVSVAGGQTPFFQAHTFVPSAPVALMLLGLIAVTATTYLITHIVLRRGLRSLPIAHPLARRLTLLVSATAFTWGVASLIAVPHWVVLAIPIIASLVVGRGEGRFAMALPGRILVLSVLAVVLAYPVLWSRVGERESATLEETLESILGSEDVARVGVAVALADARDDTYLRDTLQSAAEGASPEGLALHLWLRGAAHWQRHPSVVHVLDARGRTLDSFALTNLPRTMLPAAQKPATDADEEIFVARGGPTRLRCTVGRLRLRAESGDTLGYVVVTIPDRMDLRLKGLAALVASLAPDGPIPLPARRTPQYAELRDGVVVASSDASLARTAGGFGPEALAQLDEERPFLDWRTDAEHGYARWNTERGAAFAVRRVTATLGDALLALARLVVVGVGLGLLTAIVFLLFSLPSFRMQLQHKILLSYFVMSVVPLVLLGIASARETQQRHDARLTERLQTDLARVRKDLEMMGAGVFDSADTDKLEEWAPKRRHDVLLYRGGELQAASRTGLVDAELLSARLPPSAYRATVLERREIVRREAVYAGRPVWFGYAPVLDARGVTRATVGVPLLYEADRIEEQLTLTGSVLLAAYMLTLVLVLVGGIYASRRLTRPLGALAAGTERVAAGDLDVELRGAGDDEIGQLVGAFNAMTRELRDMTGRVRQAERETAWRGMARQVAHEIKNPLTPMRLLLQQTEAEIARDPARGAEIIRERAPKLLQQIEGLDRIARDFAQFARLPRRRDERVDVGALVASVTAEYEGTVTQGVHVHCEVAPDLPTVTWDADELRRVLRNMVLNAFQSVEEKGGGEVVLRAAAQARDGRPGVLVTIADDGVGIPEDHRDRLFEPQFSTKTRGTGLGLAIVSGILDEMGGIIEFESKPGHGTTFDLWWPTGAA